MSTLNIWDPEEDRQGPPMTQMAGYDPGRSYPPLVEPDGTMRRLNHTFSRVMGFLVYELAVEGMERPQVKEMDDEQKRAHAELLAE